MKLGTGFFINDSGLLLTNLHVVEGSRIVVVKTANGEAVQVSNAAGYDLENDLVALQVATRGPGVRLANSDTVEVGDPVIVVGNPEGLEATISNGLISGVRDIEGHILFQITAPIPGGSSGGPVFNDRGEVIGVVVSSLKRAQNINFAIPINYAKKFLDSSRTLPLTSIPKRQKAVSVPEEIDAGEIIDLVGHSVFEPYVKSVMSRLNGGTIPNPAIKVIPSVPGYFRGGELRFFDFWEFGFSIRAQDGKVNQVNFFGEDVPRFDLDPGMSGNWKDANIKAFSGRLPLGLHWGDNRTEVRHLTGAKRRTGTGGDLENLELGDWVVVGRYSYEVLYSDSQKLAFIGVSQWER